MTSGIIEILLDSTDIQSLAGVNETTGKYKVYPFVAPQDEKPPYIVVAKISNERQTQSMGKDTDSTLDYPQYDVLCYAKNFRTTELMDIAVRDALDNMTSTTEVCVFRRIWLMTDQDGFDNHSQCYVHHARYGAEQLRPILT